MTRSAYFHDFDTMASCHPVWGSNMSAQATALVVLHNRLRSFLVLCAFAVRPLLFACDHCSPQGGSDMAALGNAQGAAT